MKNFLRKTIHFFFIITVSAASLSASTSSAHTVLIEPLEPAKPNEWEPTIIKKDSFIDQLKKWWNKMPSKKPNYAGVPLDLIPRDIMANVIAPLMPTDDLNTAYLKLETGIFDTSNRTYYEIIAMLEYCKKNPNIYIESLDLTGLSFSRFELNKNELLLNIIESFKKTTTQLTIDNLLYSSQKIELATFLTQNLKNLKQVTEIIKFANRYTNNEGTARIIQEYNPNITINYYHHPDYIECD